MTERAKTPEELERRIWSEFADAVRLFAAPERIEDAKKQMRKIGILGIIDACHSGTLWKRDYFQKDLDTTSEVSSLIDTRILPTKFTHSENLDTPDWWRAVFDLLFLVGFTRDEIGLVYRDELEKESVRPNCKLVAEGELGFKQALH